MFPYSPRLGRYNLNYEAAEQACLGQGAVVASFDQLFQAWRDGLDWCNAGWLNDGTVQYPITKPREPCGGSNNQPGVRNYGRRDKQISRYDVFCYASPLKGKLNLSICRWACTRKHNVFLISFVLNLLCMAWPVCKKKQKMKSSVFCLLSSADHLFCFSAVRRVLLAGPTWQADLWWGCAGMLRWWCGDRQGGPHICCLEAQWLRSLRCWLVGWWQCPLPHLQASQELQPHRSCSALCWIPRQGPKILWCLLLQGWTAKC